MLSRKLLKKTTTSKGPTSLGEVLKQIFESDLVPPEYTKEAKVFMEWKNVVGKELAKKAVPKAVKNGILFVETFHSIWTLELQARSPVILQKLNEKMGSSVLKEIRFRLVKY